MAFFCPVRIRRNKKKSVSSSSLNIVETQAQPAVLGLGRITGSASIETLVRVGIEKEHGLSPDSKMVVLHDFTPCVDDELEVKRGQIVNVLYRENDWVYVISMDSKQEGFIPYSYCVPYNSQLAAETVTKKKLPREMEGGEGSCNRSNEMVHNDQKNYTYESCESEITLFRKDPIANYIVLYTFIARDENDVSVERGEFVTVLNKEDPDWYWIIRSDGQEGFIPSGFVLPVHQIFQKGDALPETRGKDNEVFNPNDILKYGTEFITLYEYKAQAPDDLTVRRGEWIYADAKNQTVDGWLWAYSIETNRYGFIPKAYARVPAITSL